MRTYTVDYLQPGVEMPILRIEIATETAEEAADCVFAVANDMFKPTSYVHWYNDNARSMSVGDFALVDAKDGSLPRLFRCQNQGWFEVDKAQFRFERS